jgi:hypothetical protein
MERSNCVVGVAKRRKSQKTTTRYLQNSNQQTTGPKKSNAETKKTDRKHPKREIAHTTKTQNTFGQRLQTGHSACLPQAGPAQAGFFFSFVRERVGLRSGAISLRSIAPANLPRSVDMSLFQPPDPAMRSLPTKRLAYFLAAFLVALTTTCSSCPPPPPHTLSASG